jgi:hypothetical protein
MPCYVYIHLWILDRRRETHPMRSTDENSARDADERLKKAARRALGQGQFDELLLLLLQPREQTRNRLKTHRMDPEDSMMMRAIRSQMLSVGLPRYKAEIEAEQVALTFLDKKLKSEAFLRQLVEARSPWGLLRRAAINAVLDHLRTLVRIGGLEGDVVDDDDDGPTTRRPPSDPPGIDDDLVVEEARDALAARIAEAHAAMGVEDAQLLEVFHPEFVPMPPGHARLLAQKRGITIEKLEAELDVRRARREEETAAESRMRGLEVRLNRLRDRTRWVEALIRERGADDSVAPATLPAERLRRLVVSTMAFRAASSAERAAVLRRLRQRTAHMEKTLVKTCKRSTRGHLATWQEVARLLGEVPDDPTEQQLKHAANRLVTRWRRLRAKLDAALVEE